MNILAFDTCFDGCSVAVGRGLRSLSPSIDFRTERMATGHAERLMPMVEDVMASCSMTFAMLDRIVVTRGPGTFAGTRITVAAARAFALANSTPVATMSSLNLIALNPDVSCRNHKIAVATDARRGEVYFQTFDGSGIAASAPCLVAAEAAVWRLINPPYIIAGSGAEALAQAAAAVGIECAVAGQEVLPEAIDMLFCAAAMTVEASVMPLYLRPADAKPAAQLVQLRSGA